MALPAQVSADAGIMKWDTISTPDSVQDRWDINNPHGMGANTGQGSEIIDMAEGNDGRTVAAIVRMWVSPSINSAITPPGRYQNVLLYSNNGGISFTLSKYSMLAGDNWTEPFNDLFQVKIASDDPNCILISADNGDPGSGPKQVWYIEAVNTSESTGWSQVYDGTGLGDNETIRCMDISADYGGKRDIAFGTVNSTPGHNGGRWAVIPTSVFSTLNVQLNANGTVPNPLGENTTSGIEYLAMEFSPNYGGDGCLAMVYADSTSTFYNVALRDLNARNTADYAYGFTGVEVKNPASASGASPGWNQLNNVELDLPSDFSGQIPSLSRAYISLDAFNGPRATGICQDGIFRVDDGTAYVLMDTTNTTDKAIYSIAYYGTYSSGKLLAGERIGYPCNAAVPTWFTDSPTTCPIPCWYPAIKPSTGAANQGTCSLSAKNGMGAAVVDWNADGSLALVGTGSLPATVYAGQAGFAGGGIEGAGAIAVTTAAGRGLWYQMQYWNAIANDESAFAISRNNGETWNQLSIIDTTIDWFNDVAVAPDCTTIYLASVNRNTGAAGMCNEFDSVWRASVNPNVTSPLPAIPPLGTFWERVYTRTTSASCAVAQSDLPILRVVPSCTDKPDGEIVGWAAQGTRAMAWSPDYGDYWANITPRNNVQDFAFESSTTIYVLNNLGMVQRLPYTGTTWSTNLPSAFSNIDVAHTIVAIPDGKVLVGAATGAQYPAAYSADKGVTFVQSDALSGHGQIHVIFDVDFKNNSFIYVGDNATNGSVYRNTAPAFTRWADNDMMSPSNGATGITWTVPGTIGPPHTVGQFGLVQAWTGSPQPALYSAHENITYSGGATWGSAVCRTIAPRDGMPKPGIAWDCLDIFSPLTTAGVRFTLEPSSLKACGCCTMDTNTTLYAIDNESNGLLGRWWGNNAVPPIGWTGGYAPLLPPTAGTWGSGPQGMLWAYTDCLAKKGPILKSPADGFLIGADPVTGRNQQIDLRWEQLCLATGYLLQIAKDEDFTLRINPAVNNAATIAAVTGEIQIDMDETNMTSPAAWIAPGALPEAGAIYWWRICVYRSATGQRAWSDWSEARSFTVKAGFIVNTPYHGVQLLAPNNACTGCKVKPASFSWSPWKEATKYQFALAKDSEFKTLVTTATTTTTGYEYSGTLDYSTNYFWRVKAIEVNRQNIPSDWSATFSFLTEPAPAPPPPPPAESPLVPVWGWVAIAIGAILVIVTIILIYKSRHTY